MLSGALHMDALSTILAFSVNDPLHDIPIFLTKCITWSMNTLRIKDIVHIEAWNPYFQVRYIGNFYQRI